jgi:hypothetical protein
MLHGLEAVDMFVNAVCTHTDLAAVAVLLDRFDTVHVTGDKYLCLGGGSGHSFAHKRWLHLSTRENIFSDSLLSNSWFHVYISHQFIRSFYGILILWHYGL